MQGCHIPYVWTAASLGKASTSANTVARAVAWCKTTAKIFPKELSQNHDPTQWHWKSRSKFVNLTRSLPPCVSRIVPVNNAFLKSLPPSKSSWTRFSARGLATVAWARAALSVARARMAQNTVLSLANSTRWIFPFFPRRPIFPRRILPVDGAHRITHQENIVWLHRPQNICCTSAWVGWAAALSQLSARMNLNMSNRKCQSCMVSMARCCQELWKASNLWVPAAADPGWVPNIPAQQSAHSSLVSIFGLERSWYILHNTSFGTSFMYPLRKYSTAFPCSFSDSSVRKHRHTLLNSSSVGRYLADRISCNTRCFHEPVHFLVKVAYAARFMCG